MDELVNEVVQRAGITEGQAREAVNTVVTWLKAKLPEPMAGQVDSLLQSDTAGSIVNQAGDMLDGLLGGKK